MNANNLYAAIFATAVTSLVMTGCDRNKTTEMDSKVDEMQQSASETYQETKESASETYDETKATAKEEVAQAGVAMDDAGITAKVKSSLVAEPGIAALKIDVDTKSGAVTLNGTVDTSEHKARAEEIARNTEGVKSVDNKLTIQGTG